MNYDYVTIADWDNRTAKVEADIGWISCSIDKIGEIERRIDEMENKLNCRILLKKGLLAEKPPRFVTRVTQGIYLDEQGEVYFAVDEKEKSWVEKEIEKNIFLN